MISFCVAAPTGQKLTTNTLTFPRDDHVYEHEATTRELRRLRTFEPRRGLLAIFDRGQHNGRLGRRDVY